MEFLDAFPGKRLDSLREGATLSSYGFLRYETGVGPRANDTNFILNSAKHINKVVKFVSGFFDRFPTRNAQTCVDFEYVQRHFVDKL